MKSLIFLFFGILSFLYGQNYPPNLLRYYSEEELTEIKQLTPWKYDALLFEFKDSYEWISGQVNWQQFTDTFDVRKYDHLRKENENTELTLGNGIVIRLLSYNEMKTRFLTQHPEYQPLVNEHNKKDITSKIRQP